MQTATKQMWAGALAAIVGSLCCVAPLVLITLGISGAWIGQLTALEPYRPIFIGIMFVFIGGRFRQKDRHRDVRSGQGKHRAIDSGNDRGGIPVEAHREAVNTIILTSVLTCPNCGHTRDEIMPTDACQYFYECTHCKTLLKPRSGDCCVFCSYGSVACPPIQEQRGCCH